MRSQIENSGTFEAYYAGRLGWDGEYPAEEEPKIIDEKYVNDETWVQFMEAGVSESIQIVLWIPH